MSWQEVKNRLYDEGRLPALFRVSPDDLAHSAATTGALLRELDIPLADDPPGLSYQPLLFDIYLQDVARLLDKVLTYRNEARELEVRAVKAAADYELFDKTSQLDFDLEKVRLRRAHQEVERITHAQAAQLFGQNESLNKGFARISEGQVQLSQAEVDSIDSEIALLGERWQALRDYNEEYQLRHAAPGNAHNYEERARVIISFLAEDLTEAYQKAEAVNVGFLAVFGRQAPALPKKDPLTFIDDLVHWCRATIREVEREAEHEIEYDSVIPVVQPGHLGKKSLIDAELFSEARQHAAEGKPMQLVVELPTSIFPGSNVRVRQVGLSVGAPTSISRDGGNDRNASVGNYVRLHCQIETPKQKLIGLDDEVSRPPIRFGNVGMLAEGHPLAVTDGHECRNINPVGKWVLTIDPIVVYKDAKGRTLADTIEEHFKIVDLVMHVRVRCRP